MAGDADLDRPTSCILDGMVSAARFAVDKLSAIAAQCLRYGAATWRSEEKKAAEESCEPPAEYQLLKEFVTAYSGNRTPTLLAFGDSVFLRVASEDRPQESLTDMLCSQFGNHIFQVSGSGYHSGIFERFIAVLATLPARPSIVIMPVNLRSFSPTWDLNPLYQFHAETDVLSAFAAGDLDYRLNNIDADSDTQSLSFVMPCGGGRSVTLAAFLDIARTQPVPDSDEWAARLKCIFQHHYTCPLDRENRKLQSLVKAVKTLNDLGVPVYCYITPINHEAGTEYCGSSFTGKVRENISVLQRELEMAAATASLSGMFRLDDFAFKFGRDVFFTPHNSTEHLRLVGRQFIAQRIVGICRSVSDGRFT